MLRATMRFVKTNYFKGKKITLMGLGLLGRGVGDAKFLAEQGADLIVTDLKTEEELRPSLEQLKDHDNISYTLGEHKLEDFKDRDLVVKGVTVPLDSPYIAEARKQGIQIAMSTALLVQLLRENKVDVEVVGVTGTRGKSTVTQLIHDILKEDGKSVYLAGNVKGMATLPLIEKLSDGDVLVLELDSWQLQGFGYAKISPNIAVFTNLQEDHLNYYSDQESYFEDKANIFKFQKEGDILIVGKKVLDQWIQTHYPNVQARVPEPLPNEWELNILGEHNRENASYAAEVLRELGVEEEKIKAGLKSFEPVAGRLELIREIDGVKIYNDTNATTPEATIAALKALVPKTKNIVLIAGGSDKGLSVSELAEVINESCKAVLLLEGSGTEKLVPLLDSQFSIDDSIYNSLQTAVARAMEVAGPGDTILLSPGFASFGMFKNEYDRGEQFVRIVNEL